MNKLIVPLLLILVAAPVVAGRAQTPERPAHAEALISAASGVPILTLQSAEGPETLRVFVGRSLLVNSPQPLKRVSVTDPAIGSAVIVTPNQVLIHGLAPGNVSLILWDERERSISYELQVELDITLLRDMFSQVFPRENIQVSQAAGSIILTGVVSSKEAADRAVALAQTQSKTVVNLLATGEVAGEILLQVRFAEVNRAAIEQLGVNILSTGAGNTPGTVSTGQFAPPQAGGEGAAQGRITGRIPGQVRGFETSLTLSDLLNVFVFRPDLNLGVTIRALQQRNVLQILAEPNLLALNGREASFLAGGEFPFPVVQTTAGLSAVTILFKEFGVRLKFTPNILPDGRIRLKVAPEVSALDFANALTLSGFLIPAITTRRAETEIDLRDGQSFAIAGLIDNRLTEVASKIPGLGDIPIIGKLFRSRATNRNNTELLVMVTPKLVKPLAPGQTPPLPDPVKPFLDKDKFDGKAGAAPPKKN